MQIKTSTLKTIKETSYNNKTKKLIEQITRMCFNSKDDIFTILKINNPYETNSLFKLLKLLKTIPFNYQLKEINAKVLIIFPIEFPILQPQIYLEKLGSMVIDSSGCQGYLPNEQYMLDIDGWDPDNLICFPMIISNIGACIIKKFSSKLDQYLCSDIAKKDNLKNMKMAKREMIPSNVNINLSLNMNNSKNNNNSSNKNNNRENDKMKKENLIKEIMTQVNPMVKNQIYKMHLEERNVIKEYLEYEKREIFRLKEGEMEIEKYKEMLSTFNQFERDYRNNKDIHRFERGLSQAQMKEMRNVALDSTYKEFLFSMKKVLEIKKDMLSSIVQNIRQLSRNYFKFKYAQKYLHS